MNAKPCRGGTQIVATGFVPPLQGCIPNNSIVHRTAAPVAQPDSRAGCCETPVAQPDSRAGCGETPVVQPDSRAGMGDTPVAQPDSPAGFGDTPVAQPDSSAGMWDTPVAQPDSSAGMGETPVAQPDSPAGLGETPVAQPDSPAWMRETPVAQPDSPAGLGETPVTQPDSRAGRWERLLNPNAAIACRGSRSPLREPSRAERTFSGGTRIGSALCVKGYHAEGCVSHVAKTRASIAALGLSAFPFAGTHCGIPASAHDTARLALRIMGMGQRDVGQRSAPERLRVC